MRIAVLAVLFSVLALNSTGQSPAPQTNNKSGQSNTVTGVTGGFLGTIQGEWHGALDTGAQKLRLVLKIEKAEDGSYTATMDSVDQGASGIPASSVKQEGSHVAIQFAAIGGSYEGRFDPGKSEMQGEWKQGPATLPLTLQRASGQTAGTQSAAKANEQNGLPASLAGFEDEATFNLLVNEEQLGTLKGSWKKDGSFENHATITFAGQTVNASVKITPDESGRWKQIDMESPAATAKLVRDGSSVTRTLKDKTTTFDTHEGALLYENNAPLLVSHAIRSYDRAKGGVQKFQLVILPGVTKDVTLEAKEKLQRSAAGKDLSLTKFIYALPGVDLEVYADDGNKVYDIEVPAQKAAFVREGYATLRHAEAADPLLSAPKYEVELQRAVGVPMRDGVKLATDIYLPKGVDKPPLILVRTPYKKDMGELQARFYARRGYAFAVQDCRGRFASPGTWEPFVNEAHDGYDAIEWLAKQPFTNGKIGLIGGSYLGWVQWWAASEHPPHLVTMIPNVAPPDPFYNLPYEYGAFFMWGSIWWADVLESEATADISGAALSKIGDKKYGKLLKALPVIDLDKTVLGKENPYWRTWIAHPTNDSYWQRANFLERLKDVNIPVFHQSGWFDGDGIGSKLNYLKMASYKHASQKLTLGPWGHTDTAGRMIGERDFTEKAIIDLQRDYLRWFDHWLKGVDNGITKDPLVSIFVMGSNKWLHGATYPLEVTKFQKLYLASSGKANTAKGDGMLTFDAPATDAPADHYTYDPGDPTPDPRFYEESEADEKRVRSADERKKEREGYHQKISEERQDMLVYSTPVLTRPLTFAGPVSAVLYASTSARDTDWYMTISEVGKEGKIFQLAQGKIRARFRKSMSAPELLKPDQVYEYTLDLWHTGITIPEGARLRVEVASASFPLFSRNLNTGGHNETETKYVSAQQTVYHNAKYPSHVLLPVIPE